MQETLPYEHEQNGNAESTNNILVSRTRALLEDSRLGKKYWPFAMSYAAFSSNRLPVDGRDLVPYHRYSNIKPNIGFMRVFGAWGWAKIPNPKLFQGT